jgi:hypothetical protein
MRPDDLKKISNEAEMSKAQEYIRRARKQEKEQAALREAFMHREVGLEAYERVNAAVCRAAEQGSQQVQIITFPANYCNDRGRRINNNEPDWPNSLEGFAKKAYEFYEKELKPLGYRAHVEIIDYPGGMPGNVGMFLKW